MLEKYSEKSTKEKTIGDMFETSKSGILYSEQPSHSSSNWSKLHICKGLGVCTSVLKAVLLFPFLLLYMTVCLPILDSAEEKAIGDISETSKSGILHSEQPSSPSRNLYWLKKCICVGLCVCAFVLMTGLLVPFLLLYIVCLPILNFCVSKFQNHNYSTQVQEKEGGNISDRNVKDLDLVSSNGDSNNAVDDLRVTVCCLDQKCYYMYL